MEEEIKNSPAGEEKNNELEECQKKCDEYLNNWKRAVADLANYKKDEVERAGLLVNYAREDMIDKILPIIDSFYLAQGHLPEAIKNNDWMKGFLQIQNQINEFLKKEGVEEIKVVGEKFDPNTMEIVEEVDLPAQAGGGESGMVAEELQKGYMINGKVLRPAKVKVSK